MKPANTLVERIDSAIDKILIDAVVTERQFNSYNRMTEATCKEMNIEHEEADPYEYSGYLVAVGLLGFNTTDHPKLVEILADTFWECMKDKETNPVSLANTIRELWQQSIQQQISQIAA